MKKWLNLENFIYLTSFLLPSYLIKLNFFGLPTNVLEILILVALGWAILKRSFRNFLKLRFRIAFGLMLVGLIISTLVNGNYVVGLGIIKGWFILPLILAIVAKNVVPKEKLTNIYLALYFSGLAVALISLGYYFLGQLTFDGRLQSVFNSPNYLAMYLAPAIIIGVICFWQKSLGGRERGFCYVSLGLILAAFYLTYSYAAWVSVGSCLLILGLIRYGRKINLKQGAIVISLVVLIILSQWNSQKFIDLRNVSERSSINSRLMIWSAAGKIAADNWVWGIGPGNFQTKYLEYQKHFPAYLEWAVPHPHNVYLAFWLYSGLIGLAGFVLLIYFWFKEIIKKEKTVLWLVSFGIMLLFLIHGLVDTTYFKNDLAVIFWLNFIILL